MPLEFPLPEGFVDGPQEAYRAAGEMGGYVNKIGVWEENGEPVGVLTVGHYKVNWPPAKLLSDFAPPDVQVSKRELVDVQGHERAHFVGSDQIGREVSTYACVSGSGTAQVMLQVGQGYLEKLDPLVLASLQQADGLNEFIDDGRDGQAVLASVLLVAGVVWVGLKHLRGKRRRSAS